jgi:hypothetical protein
MFCHRTGNHQAESTLVSEQWFDCSNLGFSRLFSAKCQKITILGFAGPMVPVKTAQLCGCDAKTATVHM